MIMKKKYIFVYLEYVYIDVSWYFIRVACELSIILYDMSNQNN